ncbi:MAG: COX15/CtaA family protein [Pseudomonadota bacterium]|jgi:cytochrome c oxidase assembly protein subunit 15|nr:COX15/CtaA family protein [Alphaproteobacteria bacterium]
MMPSTWLKSLVIAVILMITVGGVTRLTNSGLSITEWKPFHLLPPITEKNWIEQFNLYKKTPEYTYINKHMTLDGFKKIYLCEYAHRLLGKCFVFLLLLFLFTIQNTKNKSMKRNILITFFLGIMQGIIGWWMVKSGLKENPFVGHLHLSLHLIMAFFIFSILLILLWKEEGRSFKKISPRNILLLTLIGCTIFYGSSLAGLKAGLIYNTFPLMEGLWIPSEWSHQKPLWKNFITNASMVQWTHRFLALLTLSYTILLWLKNYLAYKKLMIVITTQIAFGIITLLLKVPLGFALAHQLCAILVWHTALKTALIEDL